MTITCGWCGDEVTVLKSGTACRFVELEPHEDIYPTRACEGGHRVFDTWYREFLPRGQREWRRPPAPPRAMRRIREASHPSRRGAATMTGNVARPTLDRLDSFIDGMADKRLTYKDLIQ
jgi:hypothetical protein